MSPSGLYNCQPTKKSNSIESAFGEKVMQRTGQFKQLKNLKKQTKPKIYARYKVHPW
jgi:hypothetical protein